MVDLNDDRLTPIQRRSVLLVRESTDHRRLEADENLGGENETYIVVSFEAGEKKFRVYLYEDEAGFFVDEEWRVWESPEYKTDDRLLSAFQSDLEDTIDHALLRR